MKTGYKEMLRDRITKMQAVDLALKYCKAKTKWIDYVYNRYIKIFVSKEHRNQTVRIILGISGKYRNFDFHTTIDWDNLEFEQRTEEIKYWKRVEEWVKWFSDSLAYIEDDLKHGSTDSDIMTQYGIDGKLLKYIQKQL